MPDAQVQIFHGAERGLQTATHALPPTLAPGELLVELSLATICGSDLHTISGQRIEPTPAILGHEGVGTVTAMGPEAGRGDAVRLRDRVTWTIADSCGRCPACAHHDLPQKCDHLFKYGHARLDDGSGLNGCYASHIVLRPGTGVVPVPAELSDAVVAPANCALATVVNALEGVEGCDSVLVQGAGMLGLYACALLRERGVTHVYCADVDRARLAWVPRFGGTPVETPPDGAHTATEPVAGALTGYAALAAAHPGGVDVVLEVCGARQVVGPGLEALRTGGQYLFVGLVHPDSALSLTAEQVIRRCWTLRGFHNYAPRHLEQAIAFLAATATTYPYEDLVSAPYALADLEAAVAEAGTRRHLRVSVRP